MNRLPSRSSRVLPSPPPRNSCPVSPLRLRDDCLPSLEGLSKTDIGFRLSALRRHVRPLSRPLLATCAACRLQALNVSVTPSTARRATCHQ
ncbi:uncharacterized protein SCHCODRAFT_02617928 [Schizophyllum commune H4-8]|uniref:uncharacterized protein n=1 Tax=Schizophyllum commune (strain H4-8 / FGSC 9210) TaxID=578458 RepID=UPI00215DE72B|nr:uncharacterized protein SCHCODRAFT_02617880 [Schizophyllum commune H4-8]XP_050200985.1 uncharacterized protein SCHCODRAFT_02617928 [Schizophyllum commune H4-8]KAI5894838.1 hypothetical protein SCHCODRAFT_02617880 [Schizophyllum commune H4-8]KAI5894852.1 hypothetical protein SCHCODRAFT_02617928 [Schizophyllum commune H4-8]